MLNRFNGVPTFGLFTSGGERQLFWRVTGYVADPFSIWLYIPLTPAGENRLARTDPADLLAASVFSSSFPRYATVEMAKDYRLIFERKWQLPQNAAPQQIVQDMASFLLGSLRIALAEEMPPARRELVFTMSKALQDLVGA